MLMARTARYDLVCISRCLITGEMSNTHLSKVQKDIECSYCMRCDGDCNEACIKERLKVRYTIMLIDAQDPPREPRHVFVERVTFVNLVRAR